MGELLGEHSRRKLQMVRERIFSMVTNIHSTLRIIYQDMAGSVGYFTWRSKQSFMTGFLNYLTYIAINVEMRRTRLHMGETIKMDSNKQQYNKNSNKEYYDKNM